MLRRVLPHSLSRHSLPLALLTALAVTAVPVGAAAADGPGAVFRAAPAKPDRAAKPRIVGGQEIQVAAVPWQVYLQIDPDNNPSNGYFECGGSIIDATRILTAAHCTFDNRTNTPFAAGAFTVAAGRSTSRGNPKPGDTPQVRQVSQIRRHPYYVSPPGGTGSLTQFADDAAVLTLSAPLSFNGNVQPIALPTGGSGPLEGTGVGISGYGLQADGASSSNGNLYRVDQALLDTSDPNAAGPVNALWLVGNGAGSSCQGDSGGPVVSGAPATLVGIVSNGARCGGGQLDNFTNVSAPEVLDFIHGNDAPPHAPRGGQDVLLSAPRTPIQTGDTLTCKAGTWSNAPTFGYTFADTRSATGLQSGPSATYRLVPGDVGHTISCRAAAANTGGVGRTAWTIATPAVVAAPKAAAKKGLSAKLRAGSSRVRVGRSVGFRLSVRNTNVARATKLRACVRIPAGFKVTKRGRGSLAKGRLCWSVSSLKNSVAKRFTVRVGKKGKRGKVKATASVTATGFKSASAKRTLTVRR